MLLKKFMKEKKVMHILNSSAYSGAEKVVITIIKNMPQKYKCCYVSPEGTIRKQLQKNDILYFGINRLSIRELRKILKEYQPDIIHAHDCRASIFSAVVHGKIPVISHLHSNDPRSKKWGLYSILYRFSIPQFQKILLVSKSVYEEAVFAKAMKKNYSIINNPIFFKKIVENKRKEYDIAFVGRLTEPKNPLRFLELVKQIQSIFSNIQVIMIGSGELEEECRQKIQELELVENIVMTGFLEQPEKMLQRSKILFIPSKWEGFGLVAVEAMACAVPVLAANVGGLPLIVNDSCGRLCSRDSDFIDETYKLLTNETYYEEKSKGAILRAKQLNNLDEYMEKLVSIYGGL